MMSPHASTKALTIMGVAGCGKSSLAQACAEALKWHMVEGDAFHSPENVAKMRAGTPLSDEDRAAWLDRLGQELNQTPNGVVLTCSALRQRYRDRLRTFVPGLCFAFLDIDQPTALQRVTTRTDHLFPPSLVSSQFATLEPPIHEPWVLRLDATLPLATLTQQVVDWIQG